MFKKCALVLTPLAISLLACSANTDGLMEPGGSAGENAGIAGAAASAAGSGSVMGVGGAAGAGVGAGAGGAAGTRAGAGGEASSAAGGSGGHAGGGYAGGGVLGALAYEQTFEALSAGLWKGNVDGAKVKAHPENAQIMEGCGPDNSKCFRVVYRQADGIHKMPPSSPVFTSSGGTMNWTASDASQTNTATDVTQANIAISGSSAGKDKASAKAIPSKEYTLTYRLYFEPGFDFAKGGKLPGLAAAAFDSGCSEDGSTKRQTSNWSERLMWRANGRLQLYSYDQSRPSGGCGVEKTIDELEGEQPFEMPGAIPKDDKFRLGPGVWYTVRISVRVNDNDSVTYQRDASGNLIKDMDGFPQPTGGNGEVSLAIRAADGSVERLLILPQVALRDECNGPCPKTVPDSADAWVNGVFFSTFFGGNETKRTTCVDTAQSTLNSVVPAKLPSVPGLTPEVFTALCASQMNAAIFPKLTWNPHTPSAARFDNFVVNQGYTNAPLSETDGG